MCIRDSFCKAALGNCGTRTDVGKTITGTRIQHATTITAVTNATTITVSKPTSACPAGAPVPDCTLISLSSPATITTARQVKDAGISGATLTSATAQFSATDVNLPVTCLGCTNIPANDYIQSVTNATTAVLHAAGTAATAKSIVIGVPTASAPLNGDAAMELASQLSVVPTLVPGGMPCSANTAIGSVLVGKWLNPGSYDGAALGQPSATPINGATIAQFVLETGSGTNLAGYVVLEKASTAGESVTAAHYDLIFPLLLNGIAVCPAPSTVGVATVFRFFGSTQSQSSNASGDVRHLKDFPTGVATKTTSAWEHIKNGNAPLFDTSGACTENYPTPASFACGGN